MSPSLSPDVSLCETDGGVVLLDERTGRYWQLNETGATVLHALLEGRDPEEIAEELATGGGVSASEALGDVEAVRRQILAASLMSE